ncbi:hypothetical protein SAMN05216233_10292 [Desulfoluna spongiiphila]|uniref:Uncharacterized protein n=1 Tax=Desulfoluna spongiiphila TaxID=419481 RepID=A0A1G5BMF0_9BACT|nr:hypothetical protein SAMN05216233_10292 [Desulfoluna spongiiphila]
MSMVTMNLSFYPHGIGQEMPRSKSPPCFSLSPDMSRAECTHIQGIRAADVVVYLKALITQKMSALGSPEG